MASAYPGGLDTFATNKVNATATTTDHPTHHNDLADAVNKIEAELGVAPSGPHATVVARLNSMGLLETKLGAADTPDDEFTAGTLDGKWTAVAGASGSVAAGTVGLLSTTNQSIYDLATRTGTLLTQVGRDGARAVTLRQDFTLPDNASMVVSVFPSFGFDGALADDENTVGISVNSSDTSWFDGTNAQKLILYVSTVGTVAAGFNVVAFDGTTSRQLTGANFLGINPILLRIARAANVYHPMFSVNGGHAWTPLGAGFDLAGAKNNFWIAHRNDAANTGIVPIVAWDWVRQGTNSIDPW